MRHVVLCFVLFSLSSLFALSHCLSSSHSTYILKRNPWDEQFVLLDGSDQTFVGIKKPQPRKHVSRELSTHSSMSVRV